MSTQPPIHFECPACGAEHDRGFVNGIDTFRCLGCGYIGHGFHPDPEIDADIMKDIEAGYAVDALLGLPVPPREQWIIIGP